MLLEDHVTFLFAAFVGNTFADSCLVLFTSSGSLARALPMVTLFGSIRAGGVGC